MLKRVLLTNVLLSISVVFPVLSVADPFVKAQYNYYPIEGDDAQASAFDINRERLENVPGGHDAYVSLRVSRRFTYDDDLNGCKIQNAYTWLWVTYTLPESQDESVKEAAQHEHWKRYYSKSVEDESVYRNWGLAAANEVKQAISTMPYHRDCITLRRDAHELASQVVNRYVQDEIEYKRVAQNGLIQGALSEPSYRN